MDFWPDEAEAAQDELLAALGRTDPEWAARPRTVVKTVVIDFPND